MWLTRDEIKSYEQASLSHLQMLAAARLPYERVHFWQKKGIARISPGRGKARQYSLGETLYLAYVGVLAEAGISLETAAFLATYCFPVDGSLVPRETATLWRASVRAGTAPRLLAVIHNGKQQIVSMDEVRHPDVVAPIPEGADWAIVVDLTRLVNVTVSRTRAILEHRPLP